MIPLSDPGNPRHRFPIATVLFITANVLVFIYQLSLPQPALENFVLAYGVRPVEITTGQDLPPATPVPVWLTIFTSMFLHGGWAHILGNMLYLWIFGDNVEETIGTPTYVAFYLAAGVAGALAHILIDPRSGVPSIGASGAISGVLAAYMVFFPTARITTLIFLGLFITVTQVPAVLLIGFWALLQFLSGLGTLGITAAGGVAYWAHIGGFAAGLVLALPFRGKARRTRRRFAPRSYGYD
ncbi:MAG: rhomboid family intramembrane serine protease [Chloroflexi bacterium]|nr:rhomboid family intramembrane serine protease [Chloroflexota bacterium]